MESLKKMCSKMKFLKREEKMNRNTKIAIAAAVVIILGAIGWYFRGSFIAATVDGRPITRWEVMRAAEQQSGKTVLGALISKELIEKAERAKDIRVSDDEINAQVSQIAATVQAQGGTLQDALKEQGMSMDQLKDNIRQQEMLKKLLGDKVAVSDQEVAQYIKDNKISVPAGNTDLVARVKDYLIQQKIGQEAQSMVSNLKSSATIKYLANYSGVSAQ